MHRPHLPHRHIHNRHIRSRLHQTRVSFSTICDPGRFGEWRTSTLKRQSDFGNCLTVRRHILTIQIDTKIGICKVCLSNLGSIANPTSSSLSIPLLKLGCHFNDLTCVSEPMACNTLCLPSKST
jgi:hypothetical protein